MFKISWSCCGCNAEGMVDNFAAMYGQCPNCGRHHGEIEYACEMTKDEFIEALSKMDENTISKYANAIQICAEQLVGE